MANLEWNTVNRLGAFIGPMWSAGSWAASPLAPDTGPTQESSVERLQRLCAAGDAYACTLLKSSRTSAPDTTTSSPYTRSVERERQADADRVAIAGRLIAAGVNPKIAVAVKAKQDVRYAATPVREVGVLTQILSWITEHPVITAIGTVAAVGTVAYAYGNGRR